MELGDQPDPEIQPAEPPPGGVDAVEEQAYQPKPVVPDLTGVGNTASKEKVPDEITEPDETDEGAANDGASEPHKEAPA
jgi:hypothetical protein